MCGLVGGDGGGGVCGVRVCVCVPVYGHVFLYFKPSILTDNSIKPTNRLDSTPLEYTRCIIRSMEKVFTEKLRCGNVFFSFCCPSNPTGCRRDAPTPYVPTLLRPVTTKVHSTSQPGRRQTSARASVRVLKVNIRCKHRDSVLVGAPES